MFWTKPRPGCRAFSELMLKDSTIDRKALQEHFGPLPTDPDEQNALWVKWLNEFSDDIRVESTYGMYLFTRDWTTIAAITLAVATPAALWLSEAPAQALTYGGIHAVAVRVRGMGRTRTGRAAGHVRHVVQGDIPEHTGRAAKKKKGKRTK